MIIQAIETRYKDYRFRIRLEARWAVFFDTLDIEWEYEKEGYDLGEAGLYLPDFWLPKHEWWVEIKSGMPNKIEHDKAIALSSMGEPVFIPGIVPSACFYSGVMFTEGTRWNYFTFGICHECHNLNVILLAKPPRQVIVCDLCNKITENNGEFYEERALRNAVVCARSARFEHGESPMSKPHKRQ